MAMHSTLTRCRATSIAYSLDLPFALIHKERARPNEVSRMTLVGDVQGRTAIIVDDMADTCGTLVKAAEVVLENGAKEAIAIVTHGILSGNAIEKLNNSKLGKLVVTNTVPNEEKKAMCPRIETIDISPTVCYRATSCYRTDIQPSLPKHVEGLTTERAFLFSSIMHRWIELCNDTMSKSPYDYLEQRFLLAGNQLKRPCLSV